MNAAIFMPPCEPDSHVALEQVAGNNSQNSILSLVSHYLEPFFSLKSNICPNAVSTQVDCWRAINLWWFSFSQHHYLKCNV